MATAPTLSDYLVHHPIDDVDTERLLARAAAEVLAGDGRSPADEEREVYDPWTEQTETPLFDLAEEPLEPEDVESLDQGTRNTIYAVCQVMARTTGDPDPSQEKALSRLQAVLHVGALDAELLADAAARHVLENQATQPIDVTRFERTTDEWSRATGRRHREFRAQRQDRLRARHAAQRHTGVHGPRNVGVFGAGVSPDIDKG